MKLEELQAAMKARPMGGNLLGLALDMGLMARRLQDGRDYGLSRRTVLKGAGIILANLADYANREGFTLEEALRAALEERFPMLYECPNCGARGEKPPHAASCGFDNPYLADDPPTCCGMPPGEHSRDCPYEGLDPSEVPKV